MNTELFVLLLSIVLGFVHLLWAAGAATRERGLKWNLSSRDGAPPPLSKQAARVDRAFQNFKETFPFFAAAVLLVVVAGRAGHLSALGAYLYLALRVIYAPLMVFDVVGIRSLVWSGSCAGIALILAQALVG